MEHEAGLCGLDRAQEALDRDAETVGVGRHLLDGFRQNRAGIAGLLVEPGDAADGVGDLAGALRGLLEVARDLGGGGALLLDGGGSSAIVLRRDTGGMKGTRGEASPPTALVQRSSIGLAWSGAT